MGFADRRNDNTISLSLPPASFSPASRDRLRRAARAFASNYVAEQLEKRTLFSGPTLTAVAASATEIDLTYGVDGTSTARSEEESPVDINLRMDSGTFNFSRGHPNIVVSAGGRRNRWASMPTLQYWPDIQLYRSGLFRQHGSHRDQFERAIGQPRGGYD